MNIYYDNSNLETKKDNKAIINPYQYNNGRDILPKRANPDSKGKALANESLKNIADALTKINKENQK